LRRQRQVGVQPLDALRQAQNALRGLEDQVEAPVSGNVTEPVGDPSERTFRLGDLVWVNTLNAEGQIIELSAEEAELQIGRLRLRARLDDLLPRSKGESKRAEKKPARRRESRPSADVVAPAPRSPGLELDIRGARVEDALPRLEQYLDAAYLSGMPFVRIIHGKGTGALRQAVQQMVKDHPLVRSWERGGEKEGGDGVTVVRLVPQA
jgi:DNA mismatch repair protein MutS2